MKRVEKDSGIYWSHLLGHAVGFFASLLFQPSTSPPQTGAKTTTALVGSATAEIISTEELPLLHTGELSILNTTYRFGIESYDADDAKNFNVFLFDDSSPVDERSVIFVGTHPRAFNGQWGVVSYLHYNKKEGVYSLESFRESVRRHSGEWKSESLSDYEVERACLLATRAMADFENSKRRHSLEFTIRASPSHMMSVNSLNADDAVMTNDNAGYTMTRTTPAQCTWRQSNKDH